jgi:tetratricopeptide (TPR) repeat protein
MQSPQNSILIKSIYRNRLAPNGTLVLWCKKDYENAIRAFDYATLIDDEFLGAFMERAKAYERLNRYEEAKLCSHDRIR